MATTLAELELALLVVLTLSLALIPGIPVPPRWAVAAGLLTATQTAALHNMREDQLDPRRADGGLVESIAEALALLVVPALTATLIAIVLYHLAHAHARAHKRLRLSLAQKAERRGGTPGSAPARRS